MSTNPIVPFQSSPPQGQKKQNNMGSPSFGNVPFNFSPFGGMDNGLNLSGAWASGGFNTAGLPPTSGWQSFFGQGNAQQEGGQTGPFGVPQPNFPANQVGSVPFSSSGGTPNFGFPQLGPKSLDKLYGKDVGRALTGFLNSGAGFNQQAIQAQMDAALPIEARSVARLENIFGNTGNAYGSTAALGVADFESQFNAALEGIFAQEYEQSVQNYLSILTGVAGDKKQEQAQKPSFLNIASEIAGSILGFL